MTDLPNPLHPCDPDRAPQRRRGAFTLVELLVVIGIIALLISILLPSLNRARASAKKVVCLSNLRQLATSAGVYQAEHKQVFMYQFGRGFIPYYNPGVYDYTADPTTHPNADQAWVSLIWPYISGDTNVLYCPSSPTEVRTGVTAPAPNLRISYKANGIVTHFGGRNLANPSQTMAFKDDPIVESASITRPSWGVYPSMPSVTAPGWAGWMMFSNPNDVYAGEPVEIFPGEFGNIITDEPHIEFGGMNMSFLDGHAEFNKWKDITSLKMGLLIPDASGNLKDTYEKPVSGYTSVGRAGVIATRQLLERLGM